uniref:ABC transporter domain-containing protein n=1 Tax=Plectus sambesii TaxID=2011161 RepID=A0A914WZL0_9BILA
NAFIYIYLVNSFSRLTDVSVFVGDLAGTLHRVVELFELLGFDRGQQNSAFIQENPESVAVTSLMTTAREECIYRLQGVSYSLPTDPNYRLIEGLTITINTGRNLLVTGQSSSGKTSLLRVLAGFWDIDSGMLERKLASNRSVYLPQKPYFPCGKLTLRQQIHYPRRLLPNGIIDHTENARIADLLKSLKLDDMIARCGGLDTPVEWDWQETLTPGEQQRLTIVRVLYRKPAIAILDEATSSVSSDCEADIYRLLRANGITFVSAGHRPSLLQFHEIELHLDGKTGYTIKELASNT